MIKITWKPNATIDDRLDLFDEIWKEYILYTSKDDVSINRELWTPDHDVWFAFHSPYEEWEDLY